MATNQDAVLGYNQVSRQHQMVYSLELMDRLVIPKGGRVLDIGCGTGQLTGILAERVGPSGYVVGIDPDEERIKMAKEMNSHNHLQFVVSDGESFPDDQYDLVVCTFVLHWIENKKAVFEHVHSNLRPGGQFAFLPVLNMPSIAWEMNALLGLEREAIINSKFFGLTFEEYTDVAIETGFEVMYSDSLVTCTPYPNITALMEFWFATSHGMFNPAFIDKDILEEFKKKYETSDIKLETPIAYFVLSKHYIRH